MIILNATFGIDNLYSVFHVILFLCVCVFLFFFLCFCYFVLFFFFFFFYGTNVSIVCYCCVALKESNDILLGLWES